MDANPLSGRSLLAVTAVDHHAHTETDLDAVRNVLERHSESADLVIKQTRQFTEAMKTVSETLFGLISAYTDISKSLAKESEPEAALGAKSAAKMCDYFSHMKVLFSDVAANVEQVVIADLETLLGTVLVETKESVSAYARAIGEHEFTRRKSIETLTKKKTSDEVQGVQKEQEEARLQASKLDKECFQRVAFASNQALLTVPKTFTMYHSIFSFMADRMHGINVDMSVSQHEFQNGVCRLELSQSLGTAESAASLVLGDIFNFIDQQDKYCQLLDILDQIQMMVITDQTVSSQLKMSGSEVTKVFQNIDDIRKFNKEMLEKIKPLSELKPDEDSVDALVKLATNMALPFLDIVNSAASQFEDLYEPYCENLLLGQVIVDNMLKNKTFKMAIRKFEQDAVTKELHAFDFKAMINVPTRHVDILRQFINDIFSHVDPESVELFHIATETNDLYNALGDTIAAARTQGDQVGNLMKMQGVLVSETNLVDPHRTFIQTDTLNVGAVICPVPPVLQPNTPYKYYLFNDMIIFVVPKKKNSPEMNTVAKIPLNDLTVHKDADRGNVGGFGLVLGMFFRDQNAKETCKCMFEVSADRDAAFDVLDKAVRSRKMTYIIGVPLDELMKQPNNKDRNVPRFFREAADYVLAEGAEYEGIFRQSCASSLLDATISTANSGKKCRFTDAYAAANLIKAWLRELPEPLMMKSLFVEWFNAGNDPEKLKTCLKKMPVTNQFILMELIKLCVELCKHSDKNRMSPHALGIVLGPNLIKTELMSEDERKKVEGSANGNDVIEILINKFSEVFGDIQEQTVDIMAKIDEKRRERRENLRRHISSKNVGDTLPGRKRGISFDAADLSIPATQPMQPVVAAPAFGSRGRASSVSQSHFSPFNSQAQSPNDIMTPELQKVRPRKETIGDKKKTGRRVLAEKAEEAQNARKEEEEVKKEIPSEGTTPRDRKRADSKAEMPRHIAMLAFGSQNSFRTKNKSLRNLRSGNSSELSSPMRSPDISSPCKSPSVSNMDDPVVMSPRTFGREMQAPDTPLKKVKSTKSKLAAEIVDKEEKPEPTAELKDSTKKKAKKEKEGGEEEEIKKSKKDKGDDGEEKKKHKKKEGKEEKDEKAEAGEKTEKKKHKKRKHTKGDKSDELFTESVDTLPDISEDVSVVEEKLEKKEEKPVEEEEEEVVEKPTEEEVTAEEVTEVVEEKSAEDETAKKEEEVMDVMEQEKDEEESKSEVIEEKLSEEVPKEEDKPAEEKVVDETPKEEEQPAEETPKAEETPSGESSE